MRSISTQILFKQMLMIGISNSPWMTSYYQNNALNMVTYQGAIVNVTGGGWLLTGFAINGAQLLW